MEKEDIEIHTFEDGFRLEARRADLIYWGVYHVGCNIDSAKTEATYQNGNLHLEMPITDMPSETKITIH